MPVHIGNSNNRSAEIMARLKESTKGRHARLESLPYFAALMAHQLPLECYVAQLRALAIIHGVMESEVASIDDTPAAKVWDERLRKLPLLESDLRFFEPRVISDIPSALQAAIALTDKIRLRRVENPVTLLGYLYVFEGSTLGNNMHLPDVSATFHLDGSNGCSYYSSYQDRVRSSWEHFTGTVNSALTDPAEHAQIIEAAHEAFTGLEGVYKALFPIEEKGRAFHVARINPEAGNHPIPDDEREIQAALKASSRCREEFPYYALRYGERGKRFSDSDTCWLATLTGLDQATMQKQIDWLGRVLATRGMPLILLEYTLRFLHEELTKAGVQSKSSYGSLLQAAEALARARSERLSAMDLEALANDFEAAVGPELAKKYKNTGRLLASAVADEKNGVKGAVLSLQGWMTDAERFDETWVMAVNDIIAKANERARGNE